MDCKNHLLIDTKTKERLKNEEQESANPMLNLIPVVVRLDNYIVLKQRHFKYIVHEAQAMLETVVH